MAIRVVCRKCRSRFDVSEKFAGRTGPCPKCKAPIEVPAANEQVTVHAPEEFSGGGRNAAGQLVLKPLSRQQTRLTLKGVSAVAGAVAAVVIAAWLAGGLMRESLPLRAVGLLLISPVLTVAAYTFLRDDEREPYRGVELWLRAAACGAVYAVLWGTFWYISVANELLTGEIYEWLFVGPLFVAVGAFVPTAALDLDYGDGVMHYGFYLLTTQLLGRVAGLAWIWQMTAGG